MEVPADLLAKYVSGEIKDGLTLAKKSLAAKTGGDVAEFDKTPAKPKRTKTPVVEAPVAETPAAETPVADSAFSIPVGSTTRV